MTTATVCCVKRCWLLCTTYSGKKAARTSEDLNGEALPEFFYSTQRTDTSAKNIVLYNIIRYCKCKPTFSDVGLLMETVWFIHGTLVL